MRECYEISSESPFGNFHLESNEKNYGKHYGNLRARIFQVKPP